MFPWGHFTLLVHTLPHKSLSVSLCLSIQTLPLVNGIWGWKCSSTSRQRLQSFSHLAGKFMNRYFQLHCCPGSVKQSLCSDLSVGSSNHRSYWIGCSSGSSSLWWEAPEHMDNCGRSPFLPLQTGNFIKIRITVADWIIPSPASPFVVLKSEAFPSSELQVVDLSKCTVAPQKPQYSSWVLISIHTPVMFNKMLRLETASNINSCNHSPFSTPCVNAPVQSSSDEFACAHSHLHRTSLNWFHVINMFVGIRLCQQEIHNQTKAPPFI